jgi:protein-S-isoprenylcysteine O-methyltransferase Ste14
LFRWRSYLPLVMIGLILLWMGDTRDVKVGGEAGIAWKILCGAVSLIGLGIRALAAGQTPVGTSGRETREQKAEVLNTTGLYSIVRHPFYLGSFFAGLGPALYPGSAWLVLIYALAFSLYYERIMLAEETYLREKFDGEFLEWAARTPAFIPTLRTWKSTGSPFSLRTVIKREYDSFFGVAAVFFLLEGADRFLAGSPVVPGPTRIILMSSLTVIWMSLRFLRKRTDLFDVVRK